MTQETHLFIPNTSFEKNPQNISETERKTCLNIALSLYSHLLNQPLNDDTSDKILEQKIKIIGQITGYLLATINVPLKNLLDTNQSTQSIKLSFYYIKTICKEKFPNFSFENYIKEHFIDFLIGLSTMDLEEEAVNSIVSSCEATLHHIVQQKIAILLYKGLTYKDALAEIVLNYPMIILDDKLYNNLYYIMSGVAAQILANKLEETEKKLAETETKLAEKEKESINFNSVIKTMTKEGEKNVNKVRNLEKVNMALKKQITDNIAKIKQLKKERDIEHQKKLLDQSEIAELKSRAAYAESRAAYAESRAADAESRAADAESRAADAESKVIAAQKLNAYANERISDFESQMIIAAASVAKFEAKMNDAEARADKAKARAEEAHVRAYEAQARADKAQAKADEAQARIDNMEEQPFFCSTPEPWD